MNSNQILRKKAKEIVVSFAYKIRIITLHNLLKPNEQKYEK